MSGIKVLDFSHALAGPYCTLLLADYGAAVYKIESPDGGDPGRGWGPPFAGDQASYFVGVNRGKRSVSINLKCPQGVELCLRMIEKTDVMIENFRPGTMKGAPALDQHTQESSVEWLGMDEWELDQLRSSGVILQNESGK